MRNFKNITLCFQIEEGSISLDSILVREKTEDDSDPDEFDFELPAPKSLTEIPNPQMQKGTEKQVSTIDKETEAEPEAKQKSR